MKRFKALICVILIATLLTGCSFHFASSVNDLISSVSPFGDNAELKKAMDNTVTNGYSLKNPLAGEYITSYNFFDLDNDDENEAITFYQPKDNPGSIRMSVLKLVSSKWSIVCSVDGVGEDVYKLDFSDVDNDGLNEIIVCWNANSSSKNHTLHLYNFEYSKSKGYSLSKISGEKIINDYYVVSFSNNDSSQLLLFEVLTGERSYSKAELYSVQNNRFKSLGETKLDSRTSSFVNIQAENAENDVRIYADALNSNGSSMLTEVIYWSNTYKTIVSPFYSYSSGVTSGTSRSCFVKSRDINSDKLIEIPVDKKFKGLPNGIKALDWKIYKNTVLQHVSYSLYVKNDSYNILIPDSYIDKITVKYNQDEKLLTVLDKSNKEAFQVKPVLKVSYNENEYKDYQIILEKNGYYYLAKCNDNKNIKITYEALKTSIIVE